METRVDTASRQPGPRVHLCLTMRRPVERGSAPQRFDRDRLAPRDKKGADSRNRCVAFLAVAGHRLTTPRELPGLALEFLPMPAPHWFATRHGHQAIFHHLPGVQP